jgi:hypothetical protein
MKKTNYFEGGDKHESIDSQIYERKRIYRRRV